MLTSTRVLTPAWSWHHARSPYERLGSDTFLVVAPTGIVCWTASARVIAQVTARWRDFPKPTGIYTVLNIFGLNVISTEGKEWRRHRRVVGAVFGERLNALVWSETVQQVRSMMKQWRDRATSKESVLAGEKTAVRVGDLGMALNRMSLNVIGKAGFGQKFSSTDDKEAELTTGHTMSFQQAMRTVVDQMVYIILIPRFILSECQQPVLHPLV
jgi:cytochrome P450